MCVTYLDSFKGSFVLLGLPSANTFWKSSCDLVCRLVIPLRRNQKSPFSCFVFKLLTPACSLLLISPVRRQLTCPNRGPHRIWSSPWMLESWHNMTWHNMICLFLFLFKTSRLYWYAVLIRVQICKCSFFLNKLKRKKKLFKRSIYSIHRTKSVCLYRKHRPFPLLTTVL